jgi:hypothetical protein
MAWWRRKPKDTVDVRPPTEAETAELVRRLADEMPPEARRIS